MGDMPLSQAFVLREDGHVVVNLRGEQEDIEVYTSAPPCAWSSPVTLQDRASSPDGRFSAEIQRKRYGNREEFGLQLINHDAGSSTSIRLGTGFDPEIGYAPRVAAAPSGQFYIVDDSGTIRLYDASDFDSRGAFQVAHPGTNNQIVALALSADENWLVGLSSWKDIMVYSIDERRLVYIRQIRDRVGWYDQGPGLVAITDKTRDIITVGMGQLSESRSESGPIVTVNTFHYIPLPQSESVPG